jgi:hypothetical protein
MYTVLIAVAVAAAVVASPVAAVGDDAGDAARDVFSSTKDSVLWVHAVVEMQMTADGQRIGSSERKLDMLGTVIGSEGLMVVSNSRLDPASIMDGRMMALRRGGPQRKISAKSDIQEVRIRMPDGDEVPGKVVLTDPDLDLAFIRVDTDSKEFEGKSLTAVDLTGAGKARAADRVFTVSRLGKVVNYSPMVKFTRVLTVVEKPRRFYVSDGVRIGCPAFGEKGRLLGVAVFRRTAKSAEDNESMPVILPAADIAEIARQAKPREEDSDTEDDEGTAEKVGSAVKGAATTAAKATAGAAKKAASATVDVVTGDDEDDDEDDDDDEDEEDDD